MLIYEQLGGDTVKLQSRTVIKVFLILIIISTLMSLIMMILGEQPIGERFLISLIILIPALISFVCIIVEINNYIIINETNVVIKKSFRKYDLQLSKIQKIEIYDSIFDRYNPYIGYKNKLVFTYNNMDIKFVYYSKNHLELKKDFKKVFNNGYTGTWKSSKFNDSYHNIIEFISFILITIISIVAIILTIIDYSWYLYVSIALLLFGVYMSFKYYKKLKKHKK